MVSCLNYNLFVILRRFDTVIVCFCLSQAQYSILDVLQIRETYTNLSNEAIRILKTFAVKSTRNRLSHIFDIISQIPKIVI